MFLQLTNSEVPADFRAGPASVMLDQQWFKSQFGYTVQTTKLQNCRKMAADGGAKGVYGSIIAPNFMYGEPMGGNLINPVPDPATSDYDAFLAQMNQFTPEEFDVILDYRAGSFPLDPTTATMHDRQYDLHLEQAILCQLRPDFDPVCYWEQTVVVGGEVPDAFYKITAIVCLMYPLLFFIQKEFFPTQHDRFGPHDGTLRMALKLHVWVGAWLIFSGTAFTIRHWCSPMLFKDILGNKTAWETIYIISGFAGCLHALASYRMLEAVQGERRLCIPMYMVAITLNLTNGILLLRDYNKHEFHLDMTQQQFLHGVDLATTRFLMLWGSITTFIYVRAHIVLMTFFKIHYYTCYTYSIIGAATITYPLSGQSPLVFVGLAWFVIYAPAHNAFISYLGWEEAEQHYGDMATNELWTNAGLVDLFKYMNAQEQGDVATMQKIENQDNFGEILERYTSMHPQKRDLLEKSVRAMNMSDNNLGRTATNFPLLKRDNMSEGTARFGEGTRFVAKFGQQDNDAPAEPSMSHITSCTEVTAAPARGPAVTFAPQRESNNSSNGGSGSGFSPPQAEKF